MKSSTVLTRFLAGFLLGLLVAVSPAAAQADGVTIARVQSGWRDASSFKRISEYFDGRENTGGEAVLRTHPRQRGGYYFLVRAANAGAPRSVVAHLQVITEANAKPREFSFEPALGAGDTVFHLGLTGADWPDAGTSPVAWRLELTDASGQVLATARSYLWEKPAGR